MYSYSDWQNEAFVLTWVSGNRQKANTRPRQAVPGPLRYSQRSENESEYLRGSGAACTRKVSEGEWRSGVDVSEAGEDKGRGLRKAGEENAWIIILVQSLRGEQSQFGMRKHLEPSGLESLPHGVESNHKFPEAQ